MKEKKIIDKMYEISYLCDECNTELIFTGDILLSFPPQYVHICNKCKTTKNLDKIYPCISSK